MKTEKIKNMNMNLVRAISASGTLLVSSACIAAEEAKSPWQSSAELGYVNVSGNTNTETVKAMFDIAHVADKWENKAHAEALSANSKTTDDTVVPAVTIEERTAAKWLVSAQTDYKFKEFDYFYGLLSYEDDRFSGFDYQAKLGLGYGRRVIHTDNHTLKLEIGPGYRSYRLEQAPPPAPLEERQDDTLLRLNASYLWKLSATSKFTEELTSESGKDQDEWKSVTGLTAKINSTLAMKISHTVKYLDKVPAGTENYDRETAVTLVFTF